MRANSELISRLEQALCALPGIGPKSAARLTHQLLQFKRDAAKELANSLFEALEKVGHCRLCCTLTERDVCARCEDQDREQSTICVVAQTSDIDTIELSGAYAGRYFVLMGLLSPMDGIGPEQLAFERLFKRVETEAITEVILALSPTVEGEATLHYLKQGLREYDVKLTRLAYGIPIGSELEYLTANTIGQALRGRAELST